MSVFTRGAEPIIDDLHKQIAKLQEELEQANQNVKDFESLAHTWKDSYEELYAKYKRDMGNAISTIDQLRADLESD